MPQANHGDTVTVHYTGKLSNGTVFDSSMDGDPLQFKIGEGQLIPGFEQAVIGMQPGESKSANVSADDAYGQYDDELVWQVAKNELPTGLKLEVGQALQSVQPDGRSILVFIKEISDANVTLDANHPLAGQDLVFDIKLVEIL